MARLAFCDYHNMIAILEKYEYNQDFHQIVDFVGASNIRFALTFNPIVYVSHIQQFWSTARIETTEEGTKILATVDGKLRTMSESSIRRNLKLNDEAGISSLSDADLFENLQLMRYNILPNQKFTFQKGQFFRQWKYLIHIIMQCMSPKSTGFNEFTSNIATALVCLATNRVYNFSKMIFDDEPASPIGDVNQALCTSIQRQQSEMVFMFEVQELEINSLKARIKLLENKDRGVVEQSRDDASIKWRSFDEGEEVAERLSYDTEEMATILTSMDAAKSTPYTRRKGKETMVESETPKKKKVQEQIDAQLARELEEEMVRDTQRMNEQIARDAEIARIHSKEELQIMIDGLDKNNETVAKYLQEYHQFTLELPIKRRIKLISDLVKYQENYAKAKLFKGMTLEEIKEKFDSVWKQIQDFVPIGLKEEADRFKRKGLRLEQESVKKLKTSEEVKAAEEVPEEKVKEMMQLVPVKEIYVEALQVKHPIID
nr:synaptobrevin, longin-like domain protein [Tanacetum cinerariifolium]